MQLFSAHKQKGGIATMFLVPQQYILLYWAVKRSKHVYFSKGVSDHISIGKCFNTVVLEFERVLGNAICWTLVCLVLCGWTSVMSRASFWNFFTASNSFLHLKTYVVQGFEMFPGIFYWYFLQLFRYFRATFYWTFYQVLRKVQKCSLKKIL